MDLKQCREILQLRDISIEEIFQVCGGSWVFQGRPNEPHAILGNGDHSNGYLNYSAVSFFSTLNGIVGAQLIQKLGSQGVCLESIDCVVSSSYAGIPIGQEVARKLGKMFAHSEKDGNDQKWTERFEIPSGARILQVEDLSTHVSTPRKVRDVVLKACPDIKFVRKNKKPVLAVVVHRPERLPITYPDYTVIPLIEIAIQSWKAEECPLCPKGSEPLKPKPNWGRFVPFLAWPSIT